MFRIILLILLLYIFYRFIFRIIVKKSTDRYLNKEKQKFLEKNPHITIPDDDDGNGIEVFSLRKRSKKSIGTFEKKRRL